MRELFRRGLIYAVALALQAALSLIATPLVTRILGPTEFGQLAAALAVAQVVATMVGLGLYGAVTRAWFREEHGPQEARQLAATALAAIGVLSALSCASAPYWSPYVAGAGLEAEIVAATALAGTTAASQVGAALLRAERRAVHFVIAVAGGAILGQVLGVGAAAVHPSAVLYLAGNALGIGTGAFVGIVLARVGPRPAPRWLVRWGLSIGLPLVPHVIAMQVMNLGDRVIVTRILGDVEAGRYHAAYLTGGAMMSALAAFNNAWAPEVYAASERDRATFIRDSTALIERAAGRGLLMLALLVPYLLRLLVPEEFRPEGLATVAVVAAVTVLPSIAYLSSVHVLFTYEHTRPLLWVTPAAAAGNVALNFLLIPSLGLIGASTATVISFGVQALAVRRYAARLQSVPIDWRSRLTAWAGGGVAIAGAAVLPVTAFWTAARAGIAIVIALSLVPLLRRVPRSGELEPG